MTIEDTDIANSREGLILTATSHLLLNRVTIHGGQTGIQGGYGGVVDITNLVAYDLTQQSVDLTKSTGASSVLDDCSYGCRPWVPLAQVSLPALLALRSKTASFRCRGSIRLPAAARYRTPSPDPTPSRTRSLRLACRVQALSSSTKDIVTST